MAFSTDITIQSPSEMPNPARSTDLSFASGSIPRVISTPIPYTNCSILPFDADGDGRAQSDERDDMAAAGIGTDTQEPVRRTTRPPRWPLASGDCPRCRVFQRTYPRKQCHRTCTCLPH
jgi:hypothetical protein